LKIIYLSLNRYQCASKNLIALRAFQQAMRAFRSLRKSFGPVIDAFHSASESLMLPCRAADARLYLE
jgi:hypothetical protein